MAEPARRSPDEVRARLASDRDVLLVCAYPYEVTFRRARLDGAISLETLNAMLPSLSKDVEIIFY